MPKKQSQETIEVNEVYRAKSADDFLLFTQGLIIASSVGPLLFKNCIQDFQVECFRDLAPSLQALKIGKKPPIRRFWIERTKKASKDADLGICLLWLTAFAERPLLIQVCAANQKQAGIIKRRISDLLHFNPWLQDLVRIQQNKVLSKNGLGEVIIESTDTTGGAHGETPDLLVLNELVHVARWSVMETHMNNADGVPQGVVIVSTNAGVRGTKAHTWRKKAIENERWSCHVWKYIAPWLDKDSIADAKSRDPIGSEFRRLWKGEWVSGIGDAIDEASIDRSFVLDGPTEEREPGWTYVAGLDLGISKDHSAAVVLGVNTKDQKIKVVYFKAWVPNIPNDREKLEVNSAMVEAGCVRMWKTYLIDWFGYDPAAGGSFMAQRLRSVGVPMRECTFANAQNLTDMAQSFVQVMKEGKLECYDDVEGRLRRDFGKFTISHRPPSTYKLEAIANEHGHADVGVALIIPLPQAIERLKFWEGLTPDDILYDENDGRELTEQEKTMMPLEMLEVYDSVSKDTVMGYEDIVEEGEETYW